MTRVFLSYSHDDVAYALALAKSLAKYEIVANPPKGERLRGPWSEWVRQELQAADAIVPLISRKALNNTWMNFEIGAALGLDKQLVPVLIEHIRDRELAGMGVGSNEQKVDAQGQPPQVAAERLYAFFRRTVPA